MLFINMDIQRRRVTLAFLVVILATIAEAVPASTPSTQDRSTEPAVNNSSPVTFQFDPPEIKMLVEGDTQNVRFNFTLHDWAAAGRGDSGPLLVRVTVGESHPNRAEIQPRGTKMFSLQPDKSTSSSSLKNGGIEVAIVSLDGGADDTTRGSYDTLSSGNENDTTTVAAPGDSCGEDCIQVKGTFLGFTHLEFSVYRNATQPGSAEPSEPYWEELPVRYRISVIRRMRVIDICFTGVVILLVVIANISMGCKTDLAVVKEVLKKPIAPAIGFCCQFIIMPLTAFAVTHLVQLDPTLGLGLFTLGCAPGGGASNIYTYLLHGDISLSVTMTLLSTVASLGMIPFWLFTLGQMYLQGPDFKIVIPYENILISLVSIMIPVAIGVTIRYKKPELAKKIGKLIKPLMVIIVICIFSLGIYANLYIFQMFTPKTLAAGALLPWVGFGLGAGVAAILRQPRNRIVTIAIETGIQNIGVPMMVLKFTLPPPLGDLGIVAVASAATFTPLPLWIGIAVMEIRKRCCTDKKYQEAEQNEEELEDLEKTKPDDVDVNKNGHLTIENGEK